MSLKKVFFILDHKLHDYRVPVFDSLSRLFEVVVVHRGPVVDGDLAFSQLVLEYKRVGPFEFIDGLNLNGCDVVVCMQNLRLINIYWLSLICKDYKFLLWGIGTSSSRGLGKEKLLTLLMRNFLTFCSDGLALYSSFPVDQYWRINKRKIKVIGNSVESKLSSDTSGLDKSYILFFGSITQRKGILSLLEVFSKCLVDNKNLKLVIAGDGPELERVKQSILALGIDDHVEILGRVTCPVEKLSVFSKAYFVVSPNQAGLSVVESFSFGVPFVTSKGSITGGEILSVYNDVNGVLFEGVEELEDVINSFFDGRRDCVSMGGSAYKFYCENLTIDRYIGRFSSFINESLI